MLGAYNCCCNSEFVWFAQSVGIFNSILFSVRFSYDLDLDTRLAEETTVLVENYTVSLLNPLSCR